MGVTLSTHSTLAPISLASTIIGFISFAFTVTTWLRVFWENLHTLFEAESEIHGYLSNLRIEIWEEKASLRQLRRHNKDYGHSGRKGKARVHLRLDDVTIRSMQDIVRHLTRRFKKLEAPFLEENTATGRRRPTSYPYARESGSWEDDHKSGARRRGHRRAPEGQQDLDEEYDEDWANNEYCNITLAKRFVWLRRRSEAINLTEALSRLQTRRIARQVGELTVTLYEYGDMIEDIRDDMQGLTGRLNRVVGIRRVD